MATIFRFVIWTCPWLVNKYTNPSMYENYLSIAVLAALDTLFGGIRAQLQQVYDDKVFVSGFFLI